MTLETATEAPGPTDATRTQKRAIRTRNRLMKAALSIFSEKGFDSTTIEDITERADLGKGTFYRHFPGKDELILDLTEQSTAVLTQEIDKAATTAQSTQDLMNAFLSAHRKFFMVHREEFLLLFQSRLVLNLQKEDTLSLETPFERYLETLQRHIARFIPSPVNRAKVRHLACAIAGFVSGFFSFALVGLPEADIDLSLAPLRQTFVSAASAFLFEQKATKVMKGEEESASPSLSATVMRSLSHAKTET